MDNAPILTPGHGPAAPGLSSHELDAVRARRASLRQAVLAVKEVLRTPPDGAAAVPAGALLGAVTDLADVWATHSAETESADGVLAQVLNDSPRLAPAIDRLRREHGQVAEALATAGRALVALAPGVQLDPVTGVPDLVRALDTVDRHRRDGRNLLHDAYHVDLGLGE